MHMIMPLGFLVLFAMSACTCAQVQGNSRKLKEIIDELQSGGSDG